MLLVIASNNENKVREIKKICNFDVSSLNDMGIIVDTVEDGDTLKLNSYKKAYDVYSILKYRGVKKFKVLGDDSGLLIDYLDGRPGVMSKRFAGDNCDFEENNDKVLNLLNGVREEERGCSFVTVLTLIDENGDVVYFEGEVRGKILKERRGNNGFGYDSIFYVESLGKSFGEMEEKEKNLVSHRGLAMSKLNEYFFSNK